MLRLLVIAAAAAGVYYYLQQRNEARPNAPRRAPLPEGVRARVRNGVVTLTGATTEAERDRILALALKQPGIERVVNNMEIEMAPNVERVGAGDSSAHAPLG